MSREKTDMRTKRYKINLRKQIAALEKQLGHKPKRLACKLIYKHGSISDITPSKKAPSTRRNILHVTVFESDKSNKKARSNRVNEVVYSIDRDGYTYLPYTITNQLVYGGEYGENKYSMIFLVDRKTTKLLVPWLNQKGTF